MTDNDVIRALECCSNAEPCANCPYQKQCDETDLAEIALNLISRQKAEIERLKKGWRADVIETAELKAEAVKEFAERLILVEETTAINCATNEKVVRVTDIENLVKETAGAKSGSIL